jgi:FixJ family two-component response regulator
MTLSDTGQPLVAVVDDERDVRTTIVKGLEKRGFRCHPFGNGSDLIEALDYLKPDAILLDLRMPGIDGMETLKAIPGRHRHVCVLIFTSHGDIPVAIEAMKAGACDFIEKPASLATIAEKIDAGLAERAPLRERMQSVAEAREKIGELTPREREIMELACDGLISGEIAGRLGLSVRTVENHRHNAIKKLKEDRLVNILKIFQLAQA